MNLKYRPFAIMGFVSLAVLISCVFFDEKFNVISIACGVLLFVVSLIFKGIREKIYPFYIASALVFSALMFTSVNEYDLKYAENFVDKTATIQGVIVEEPTYSNSRYYYVVDLNTVDNKKLNAKIRISLANEIGAEPFDTIRLDVKIYKIASESRDVQLYYQSKGIFLGGYAYNSEDYNIEIIKREKDSIPYMLYLLKEEINHRILDKLPNDNGATIIAMLLGDKSALSDDLNEDFREVGIAPIFAVSGLHLTVWIMGLYGLLSQLGVKKRLNSLIGIFFTLFFMLLTGLSASVCRAGLMMLLLLVGNLFYRKVDSLNSLGFAAFALCAFNPYIVADVGFLMSFSATLGIVVLMPVCDKYVFNRIPDSYIGNFIRSILGMIAVSISATIGVLPVTVFFIGYISVWGIISNLLLTYVATICMFLGGLISITYKIDVLSDFIAFVSGLLSEYILWIVKLISDLSVTTISTENIFWKIGVILACGVVAFSLLCFKKAALLKSISAGLAVVITVSAVASYVYFDDLTQVRILNVGNGISAVIYKNGQKVVFSGKADGYYKVNEITDNLNSISRTPSYLLLAGDIDAAEDSDNLELVADIDFDKIVVPASGQTLEKLIPEEKLFVEPKVYIDLWEDGTVEYRCNEDFSLAYATFEQSTFLFLFNAKKYVEIDEKFLDADYLVCSGYIPNCISPDNFKRIILCGDSEYEQHVYDYVVSCGGQPLKAYEYESVRFNIRDGSEKLYVTEG